MTALFRKIAILGLLAMTLNTAPVDACNISALLRSLNRAVEKYTDGPTPARADRICRILARIHNKFPNFPLPPPPDGVWMRTVFEKERVLF